MESANWNLNNYSGKIGSWDVAVARADRKHADRVFGREAVFFVYTIVFAATIALFTVLA